MPGSGHYGEKGTYNGYNKNHKERADNDYYATPPAEVLNILRTYNHDFSDETILEPCAGEGHMASAIWDYLQETNVNGASLLCTEMYTRENKFSFPIAFGELYDFLSDDYPINPKSIDWIIMNPPYNLIESFMEKAIERAQKGIIMFARLQCLESQRRYEKVFSKNPPSYIYIYVDRVNCWKNGINPERSSVQSYAWYIWDKDCPHKEPIVRWIRRVDKV